MKECLAILAFSLAVPAAFADVPNACEILKVEDINSIAGGSHMAGAELRIAPPTSCPKPSSDIASSTPSATTKAPIHAAKTGAIETMIE